MIQRSDVMPVSFLKMEKYTGSYKGMRYRMEMTVRPLPVPEGEEGGKPAEEKVLAVTAWPEPFAYDHTPEEQKIRREFSFDEDGILAGIDWLNEICQTICGTKAQ